MERAVLDLAAALRLNNVAVGVDTVGDALRSLTMVDVSDRNTVRSALAATMVQGHSQRALFDELFDALLPPHNADRADHLGGGDADVTDPRRGDQAYHLGRDRQRGLRTPAGSTGSTSLPAVPDRGSAWHSGDPAPGFGASTYQGPEVHSRAARAGRDQAADLSHIELMDLPDDDGELGRIVRRLAPTLATHKRPRRRGGRNGRVDMRRTIRRSLSTGGVLADPSLRVKRPHRPDLLLLCDVSGSMRTAARFTLLLSHTFQRSFSSVRTLAFVDVAIDLTSSLAEPDLDRGLTRALHQLTAAALGSASDYGTAFDSVLQRHASLLGPRTIVVVLGDARTNYRPLNTAALMLLRRRSHELVWLNPEPKDFWDVGDSAAAAYAAHCDRMVECRTVEQTAAAFAQLPAR